jgi:hypothetical protein
MRHVEPRRVVARIGERERRVAIRGQRGERVRTDAPRPPQDADVELEQSPRVAAGEQDRDQRAEPGEGERDPQDREHDDVRQHQDPLHQPHRATEPKIELAVEPQRIRSPN